MKSHTCVDFTCRPSGRLIVSGFVAILLLSTLTPSIIKIDVAPVSAIACDASIVIAFNTSCVGLPNICWAAAANELGCGKHTGGVAFAKRQLDVTTVRSSSSSDVILQHIIWVGYEEKSDAETKLLNLFALPSAPPCQKRGPICGS